MFVIMWQIKRLVERECGRVEHLCCEVLGAAQGILRLYGEAAPQDEGDEGHARPHQQDEIFYTLQVSKVTVCYSLKAKQHSTRF